MPTPPAWVSKDLQNILGLDEETVKQVIIPDLEGYTSQVRLKGHLQDFLGSAPSARAFTERYVSLRFPSLAPPTPLPASATPKSQTISSTPSDAPRKPKPTSSKHSQPPPGLNLSSVNAAFGPGGRVYQKSPALSGSAFGSTSASGSGPNSRGGSGTVTPRSGGALTIHEAKPRHHGHAAGEAGGSGRGKKREEEKIWDAPKSKETIRLEGMVQRLREVQAGGKLEEVETPCFCQARNHELSRYTPACASCGLILCALQPTDGPCPSCQARLYTASGLARLIMRLEDEVAAQVALEQSKREERERLRLERLAAQAGGGAFPSLPGGHPTPAPQQAAPGRRVLTIGSGKNAGGKGKGRATITTTTYTTVPVATPDESENEGHPVVDETIVARPRPVPLEPKRVDKELSKEVGWRQENDRPWGNFRKEKKAASGGVGVCAGDGGNGSGSGGEGEGKVWVYLEKQVFEVVKEGEDGRRRRAKKGKSLAQQGIGADGRRVVGAASG